MRRTEAVGLPLGVVERGAAEDTTPSRARTLLGRLDRGAVAVRPQLFGYQFLYELAPPVRSELAAED